MILRPYRWLFHHLRLLFGDQAMFVRRREFWRIGGYSHEPAEDISLCDRITHLGKIREVDRYVETSARRFDHYGTTRVTLIHVAMVLAYLVGQFDRMRRMYPPQSVLDRRRSRAKDI